MRFEVRVFDVFAIVAYARGPVQDPVPIELDFAHHRISSVPDARLYIGGMSYGFARTITRVINR